MTILLADYYAYWEDYYEDCERIARECEEEGYPPYSSKYKLRVARLKEAYPEPF